MNIKTILIIFFSCFVGSICKLNKKILFVNLQNEYDDNYIVSTFWGNTFSTNNIFLDASNNTFSFDFNEK